jgi:hypothetical protein
LFEELKEIGLIFRNYLVADLAVAVKKASKAV